MVQVQKVELDEVHGDGDGLSVDQVHQFGKEEREKQNFMEQKVNLTRQLLFSGTH